MHKVNVIDATVPAQNKAMALKRASKPLPAVSNANNYGILMG